MFGLSEVEFGYRFRELAVHSEEEGKSCGRKRPRPVISWRLPGKTRYTTRGR